MVGYGLEAEREVPPGPWQPYDVDMDEDEAPPPPVRPQWSWSTHGPALALVLALLIAGRPPASTFQSEVALRRKKQPPQQLLQRELRAFAGDPQSSLRTKLSVGRVEWPEESGLWARDMVLLSTGCTAKACFVGAVGRWWRLPAWQARHDLYVLFGLHVLALALHHQYPALYFAHVEPRRNRPRALPTAPFRTPRALTHDARACKRRTRALARAVRRHHAARRVRVPLAV